MQVGCISPRRHSWQPLHPPELISGKRSWWLRNSCAGGWPGSFCPVRQADAGSLPTRYEMHARTGHSSPASFNACRMTSCASRARSRGVPVSDLKTKPVSGFPNDALWRARYQGHYNGHWAAPAEIAASQNSCGFRAEKSPVQNSLTSPTGNLSGRGIRIRTTGGALRGMDSPGALRPSSMGIDG